MAHEFDDLKQDHIKSAKRLDEIRQLLQTFIAYQAKKNIVVSATPQAAEKIVHLYFAFLNKEVKRFVPKRINRYKIGALTELCVVATQPLQTADLSATRRINAEFAFFVSASIIREGATPLEGLNKFSGNKRVNDVFDVSKNQRLVWLEAKSIRTMPVFITGLALFTLFELYNQRFQALPL